MYVEGTAEVRVEMGLPLIVYILADNEGREC